ncbi:TetR family transcriptional regulator [Dactylosporangium sp. CA-092794]|uniref:TetR/AcrR family transcriptional regulator n=1 Tax=Dactylosporangium sp. CA-092794 TaxID=3239929 RepID=UPI003D9343BB
MTGRHKTQAAATLAPATRPAAADEPAPGRSRQAILAAAAELFAEHGYDQVTIRDIAVRADLSPAMVMKCGGSKRELFLLSAKIAPPPLPDVPRSELGARLVEELLIRSRRGAIEPLARALNLRLSAPDPDSVRQQFTAGYLDPLTERLGGDTDARLRAELVVAALTGLAATTRIFNTPAAAAAPDEVIRRFGTIIQDLIDR